MTLDETFRSAPEQVQAPRALTTCKFQTRPLDSPTHELWLDRKERGKYLHKVLSSPGTGQHNSSTFGDILPKLRRTRCPHRSSCSLIKLLATICQSAAPVRRATKPKGVPFHSVVPARMPCSCDSM